LILKKQANTQIRSKRRSRINVNVDTRLGHARTGVDAIYKQTNKQTTSKQTKERTNKRTKKETDKQINIVDNHNMNECMNQQGKNKERKKERKNPTTREKDGGVQCLS
jgi:hypothetical protein